MLEASHCLRDAERFAHIQKAAAVQSRRSLALRSPAAPDFAVAELPGTQAHEAWLRPACGRRHRITVAVNESATA